jgi:P27 family predicted phage terminase small subunit
MRGRKPKPSALHALTGTARKRNQRHEPQPTLEIPEPPAHLSDDARAEWFTITPHLFKLNLLTRLDATELALYCSAVGLWTDAERHIGTEGAVISTKRGHQIQNPWLAIRNKNMELAHKFLSEFGLTPASRTRLNVTMPAADELGDFINDKGRFFGGVRTRNRGGLDLMQRVGDAPMRLMIDTTDRTPKGEKKCDA